MRKLIEAPKITLLLLLFFFMALYVRYTTKKKFDVGLGPMPLINNLYQKMALELFGYSARTFVKEAYYITRDFDYNFESLKCHNLIKTTIIFFHIISHYKIIYTYFDGLLLPSITSKWLRPFVATTELLLYKFARIQFVVMPYGSDVQDMAYCPNLLFKNALIKDYPLSQRKQRDLVQLNLKLWTKYAAHIISGCDWVWYMYYWDTLLLGHFCIDTARFVPPEAKKYKKGDVIKIFHAPNHTAIKGSEHFIQAVNELKEEGYPVEIVFAQRKSNQEILQLMQDCDIIADQLIIGWYAMTALEGMCFAKPILCYLNQELLNLYCEQKILNEQDMPIVHCTYETVKTEIKKLLDTPELINKIGKKSRKFVETYHSLEYIGNVFNQINLKLGIHPINAYKKS